ncbi:MAG TPA: VWA domain-containing protein [Isosphaeraceae bacterium]|jgi:magnesium chelatase subunit D|nr:VWA domain-containing protein [Isosphaeraceae bacterium]
MIGEATYPFSALVAQSAMKRALILAAVHPGLGGVLIRGSKGAAKSTAVRALAALLPEIEVFEGDPFQRAQGEQVPGWPLSPDAKVVRRPVSLVNLPVGATDDRVVGSLNIERALGSGTRSFEPGLLASAHRGILYIDEVNLLGDHLVDLLLDAAAMGVNHVEREGVAFRHPARFVLIGTMNPEEGELRPQLLDRFGLVVEVEPMNDPRDRAEVVRRRLHFETDPVAFRLRWAEADRREGQRIAKAQRLLPEVTVPDPVVEALCARCAHEGADGLRADLTIYKAATALAAYEGRTIVTTADVEAVAELALAHRRTHPPQGPPPSSPPDSDERSTTSHSDRSRNPELENGGRRGELAPPARAEVKDEDRDISEGEDPREPLLLPAVEPRTVENWTPRITGVRRAAQPGRRGGDAATDRRGAFVRAEVPRGRVVDPALVATLRAAAPCQRDRGRASDAPLILRPADLRVKVRTRPAQHLILFVVDASRSMGARDRMRLTKGAVLSLIIDAYQKRDRVGLITFGGTSARLVLAPTRSARVAARALADLPIGGTTPLAAGLALANRVIAFARRREPGVRPLVVLLTDGRGNVPTQPGRHPESEASALARQLGASAVPGFVVDTEGGPVRLGKAKSLAAAWGAQCKTLEELGGTRLPEAVRKALFARIA